MAVRCATSTPCRSACSRSTSLAPRRLRTSMRRSGVISALLLLLAGCFPYGFAGGGLPSHVKTVAVLPFDNQTPSPDLQREVFDAMRRGVQSRLGLRDAPEARADAILRGTLLRYDADIPVAYSADPRQS